MAIKSALGRQFGTQFDSVFDVVKSNSTYEKSGGKTPSLDLNFAKSKTLVDSRSTKNKITFTRASSGTFVDADGLIKTTPVNLLLYSDYSQVVGTSDAQLEGTATAPDGTNTARRYSVPSSGLDAINKTFTDAVAGTDFTFSVFIRSTGVATSVKLQVGNPAVEEIKTITTTWQRYSTTKISNNSGLVRAYVRLVNVGDEIEIWGGQLEEGTTATEYIPTTNTISGAPRFDNDFTTSESQGLLIEESRTNKIRYSQDLSTGGGNRWKIGDGGFTQTNSSFPLAPDGVNRMWLVNLNTTSGTPNNGSRIYVSGMTFGSNINVFSFYARSLSGTGTFPAAYWNGTNYIKVYIPLTTTTRRYKIYVPAGTGGHIVGFSRRGTTHNETLTKAYIWGCQCEEGDFDTSYIRTDGSQVTRAADVAKISGADFAKTNLLQYSESINEWDIGNNSTVIPNAITAPDGTLTADRLTCPTQNSTFARTGTINAGVTYTASVYAKAVTPGTNDKFTFNIGGGSGNASSQITATGEWQRFSFTITPSTVSGGGNNQFHLNNEGDGFVSDIYFWGAQLEESATLTDYTPSVESFVSRASSATFIDDATGFIKTTPVNRAIRSEEINLWGLNNGSVTSNVAVSPIGDQTSDKWIPDTTNNFHFARRDSTFSSFESVTYSIYAKQAGYRFLLLNTTLGSASGNAGPIVDLQDGVVVDNFAATYTTTVTNVGNGWYRIAITFTGNGGNIFIDHNPLPTSSVAAYTGDGTSGILLWGSQLEEGSTATDYIRTIDTISGAARFENNQLILEESRTNFVLNSDSVQGSTLGSPILNSTASVVSPRGITETVRQLGRDVQAGGAQTWRVGSTSGGTPNTTYAISFYAKTVSGGTTTINIDINDLSPLEGQETTITGEWTRIIKTGGSRNNALRFFDMNMRSSTNEEFYVFGAQIEAGDFATSYISTGGSSVTRAADVSTSALGVDSFHNQSEGTLFVEALNYAHPITGTALVPFSYSDNSFTNLIQLGGSTGSNVFNFDIISSGSQSRVTLGNYSSNNLKSAGAYKVADQAGSLDGAPVVNGSPSSIPSTINRLDIGNNHTGGLHINGRIKRFTYFNTRLSDDKLKSITT